MIPLPGFLHRDLDASHGRPARSLVQILGTLGPAPTGPGHGAASVRAARAPESVRRHHPGGPPRPAPHGAAPTAV